jgi:anaerobic magnesium-protoporphyrin IX monomethyl ester cyclase
MSTAKRALFVNAPSAFNIYGRSKVRATVPVLPVMSLAVLAGEVRRAGHEARIVDLAISAEEPMERIAGVIREWRPDMVGITATTPIFSEAAEIAGMARSILGERALLVAGGPHPQAVPEECLRVSKFDVVAMGDGEETVVELINGEAYQNIHGICYLDGGEFKRTMPRVSGRDLDGFAMPAFDLFEIDRYRCSRVISRQNPVGPIEMTRGCPFGCTFCNRARTKFRIKSVERIVDELKEIRRLGFREFHVVDDQFTSNPKHAKAVLEGIIQADLGMTWNLRTGLRVDMVDDEFMALARRAGCYQMGCGFESGSQEGLDSIDKGTDLDEAIKAVAMAKRHGIEIVGFFMIGLPGETVEQMRETMKFSRDLDPTFAKCTIVVPFPGTVLFEQYKRQGLIKSLDWNRYNFHSPGEIYDHPNLSWKVLRSNYNRFHRQFYFRPSYLWNRFHEAVRRDGIAQVAYMAWTAMRTFGPTGLLRVT